MRAKSRLDWRFPSASVTSFTSSKLAVGFRVALAAMNVTADSPNLGVNTNDLILTIIAAHGTVPGAGHYALGGALASAAWL